MTLEQNQPTPEVIFDVNNISNLQGSWVPKLVLLKLNLGPQNEQIISMAKFKVYRWCLNSLFVSFISSSEVQFGN